MRENSRSAGPRPLPPRRPGLPPVPASAAVTALPAGKRQRTDGVEARQCLLASALRLFAEKGFAKTSIRNIAEAAGVNMASISYYFGDKAGLYHATFTEPMGNCQQDLALYDQPHFTLRQSLQGFIASFLEPMKQGELVQQCMRLHFREMLEPTGLWADEIEHGIKPAHAALVAILGRHLGVPRADDDLHRLAFSIAGLAVHLYMTRDLVQAIRPRLLNSPKAIDSWAAQMVDQAEAMVALEAARRKKLLT
jgi:TetR/AcrR family transcriptional regulator, regulator of cefoperazone and chloramphenicol sensitivity